MFVNCLHCVNEDSKIQFLVTTTAIPFLLSLDTLVGVIGAVGDVLSGGKSENLHEFSIKRTRVSRFILTDPFYCFVQAISISSNDPFKPTYEEGISEGCYRIEYKELLVCYKGKGLLTNSINKFFKKKAEDARIFENSFFKRHFVSRGATALLLLGSIVTRTVDAVIGVIAAIGSIVTLGKFASLNNTAYRGLQFPGIIHDIHYCAVKTLNPWAK